LSKGAIKAIDLLDEKMYLKLFLKNTQPVEDILQIYRVFFMILFKPGISDVVNDKEFWEACCQFFITSTILDEVKLGKKFNYRI